ncbi:hypothetical protein ACE4XG_14495 [Enterococcus faecalis]|uniref:hypothetical protein n=1 Tax=Enterococcus faecalis TaxID=1351 RepID=UPI001B9554FC|nr:hypothetical protein [Enterococcus faecalis]HBC4462828.1 hypothetical protein [Enterococcus faecalis]
MASSMFASHFVAQTTLLGDALLSPNPPWNTIQNVAVLNPKKETGNVSISVSFFGKIRQAFFRRFRRKKHTHYSLTFFDILIEEGKINI